MTIPVKYRSQSSIRYSLEEFQVKYDLPADEAARLHTKFGPSARELDAIMRAKSLRGQIGLDERGNVCTHGTVSSKRQDSKAEPSGA
jgi:hypothetical protein